MMFGVKDELRGLEPSEIILDTVVVRSRDVLWLLVDNAYWIASPYLVRFPSTCSSSFENSPNCTLRRVRVMPRGKVQHIRNSKDCQSTDMN